jgi:hypothetical protein
MDDRNMGEEHNAGNMQPQLVSVDLTINGLNNLTGGKKEEVSMKWWQHPATVKYITTVLGLVIPFVALGVKLLDNMNNSNMKHEEIKYQQTIQDKETTLKINTQLIGDYIKAGNDDFQLPILFVLRDLNPKDDGITKWSQDRIQEIRLEKEALKKSEELGRLKADIEKTEIKLGAERNKDQDKQDSTEILKYESELESKSAVYGLATAQFEQTYTELKKVEKQRLDPVNAKTVVASFEDISIGSIYSLKTKIPSDTINYVFYSTKPGTFGSFGEQIGTLTTDTPFKVISKHITSFRNYKWLEVEILNSSNLRGWYSWENTRTNTILEQK